MIDYLNNHSEWIMLVAAGVLLALLLVVLFLAFFGRWRLNRLNRTREAASQKLGDLIIRYLSGDATTRDVKKNLSTRIDYAILLEQVNILGDTLGGEDEREKLSELIDEPEIKKYYRKRLLRGDPVQKAKACIYYSKRKSIHPDWIPRLLVMTADPEPVLTYAATGALLVHGGMEEKEKALWNALTNRELSIMALSDLFVKFTVHGEEYHREEMQIITGFIAKNALPGDRQALLIRILDELEYYHSMEFLMDYYLKQDRIRTEPVVLIALIRVLTKFGFEEILDDIHKEYVVSDIPGVRQVAAWSMGFFLNQQSVPFLKWLLNDPQFYVRYEALKSIFRYPDIDAGKLKSNVMQDEDWASLLGEIKAEMA